MTRSAHRRPSRQQDDPFLRPLDVLLGLLRKHGLDYRPHPERVDRWLADCPVCGGWRKLELVECPRVRRPVLSEEFNGGPVAVRCVNGCHESRIVAALAAVPERDREAIA